jgi:hypothetical protein
MLYSDEKEIQVYPKNLVIAFVEQYISPEYKEINSNNEEWINVNSPFYEDTKMRLGFNLSSGIISDFKRGSWDLEHFLLYWDKEVQHFGLSNIKDVKTFLFKFKINLKKNGIKLQSIRKATIKEDDAVELSEIAMPVVKDFTTENIESKPGKPPTYGLKALRYLYSRNIDMTIIKKNGLKYIDQRLCPTCDGTDKECPDCGGRGIYRYFGRIFIPSYENGKLVYFQARDFLSGNPKFRYINPAVQRRQVVYFYDLIEPESDLLIFEGPIDAMYFKDYSTTALMGNKMSKAFAQKIGWKNMKRVIFVPDFDIDPETRSKIISNLDHNIKKIQEVLPGVEVGVYNWKAIKPGFKDVNDAKLNCLDLEHIIWPEKDKLIYNKFISDLRSA